MPRSRGHLSPGAPGVELLRFELREELSELVRHVWIVRWALPPGEVSQQRVLTYPTFNLVIMSGAAALYGPDPRLYVRELTGNGWAVGLLLRPAAGVLLSAVSPGELVAKSTPVTDAPIAAVESAMQAPAPQQPLQALLEGWLLPIAARVDARGRLVNRVAQLAEDDVNILRVSQLAEQSGISRRSLERLVEAHIGVSPKWLIECRRLQEAATTLHTKPDVDLSALALSLDYVDYAHFSRRYKEVLGETPDQSRARAKKV